MEQHRTSSICFRQKRKRKVSDDLWIQTTAKGLRKRKETKADSLQNERDRVDIYGWKCPICSGKRRRGSLLRQRDLFTGKSKLELVQSWTRSFAKAKETWQQSGVPDRNAKVTKVKETCSSWPCQVCESKRDRFSNVLKSEKEDFRIRETRKGCCKGTKRQRTRAILAKTMIKRQKPIN